MINYNVSEILNLLYSSVFDVPLKVVNKLVFKRSFFNLDFCALNVIALYNPNVMLSCPKKNRKWLFGVL